MRFFNRPSQIEFKGDLVAGFDRSAGAVAVMPLYGIRREPGDIPGSWGAEITHGAAKDAAFWASALTRYPAGVKESFSLERSERWAEVRDEFQYMPVPDEWRLPTRELAPVPPVGVIATSV